MRLPSWGEFVEKEKIWEKHIQQKINEKISDAVKDRPVLDMVFSASLTLLPPPLGAIAQNIYDNAKGSSDDPISEVVKYFEKLEEAGREHYEIVANKLDSALIGIQDLKVIGNKASEIQELLIAEVKVVNSKIDDIKEELNEQYVAMMKPRWENEKMAFVLGEGLTSNVMSSYSYKKETLTERRFFDICTSLGIQISNFENEERIMINMIFDRSVRTELKHQFVPYINERFDLLLEKDLSSAFNFGENYALLRDTLNLGHKNIQLPIATMYKNFLKRKDGLNKGGAVYTALECIIQRLTPFKVPLRELQNPRGLLEEVYKCVEIIES